MADSLLRVTVHNCKGLRGVDFNGLSDPYVKLFLIPWHKKNYFKTSIVHKCLNPEYQESFILQGITHDVLEKKSLGIIVMDHDDFGSDNPLGAARIPLYEATGPEGMHLRKLLADLSSIRFPREGVESEEKGRILLTISYSAQDCALTIGVDRALDLPAADSSGLADPYIKCILEVRARSMKTKTKTCMRDLNPTFNEKLVFSIKQQDLPYCKLVVAVWHRKKVAKDVHLGKVVFQSPAFWQKYAMQPSYQQTEWHPLSDYKNLKD